MEEEQAHARAWTRLRWRRGPATLEDGFVVLDPQRSEEYVVGDETDDLLWDLVALSHPTDILGFVRRYGLLWNGPDSDETREPVADWEGLSGELGGVILQRLVIEEPSRSELDRIRRARRALGEDASWTDTELLEHMSAAVAMLVSEGLRNVRLRVISATSSPLDDDEGTFGVLAGGDPSRFGFMPEPSNLVDLAYWQLASGLVAKGPIARCAECGRPFPVKHGRQRFHDERCAARARQRRHAEKKRREENDG